MVTRASHVVVSVAFRRFALRSLLAFWAITFVAAGPASAGTFTAFGPRAYQRNTGTPVTVRTTFSVLNPSTQYLLRIRVQGVASAVISLNGITIVDPSQFNQNITIIEKPIALAITNELAVELRGAPGGTLAVEIVGTDNDPPTITAVATPTANTNGWNKTDVVVSFTCSDATSGVSTCTAPITVTTEGANRVVSGTAVDKAGNTAMTGVTLNIDKTPPIVTASQSPPANTNGWNNSPVVVTFAATDSLSGVAPGSLSPPVTLSAEGTNQSATGHAMDLAGNVSSVTLSGINIDRTPPVFTFGSPTNGAIVFTPTVTVTGTVADGLSGVASVSCNGAPATVSETSVSCVVTLTPGQNSIGAIATDVAGNTTTSTLAVVYRNVPTITITSPANLSYLNISPTTVTGTVDDPSAAVTVNGIAAPSASGAFSVAVPLIEGNNTLTAVATNQGASSTASIQVTLDTTPPRVVVSSPTDGFSTSDSSITVTGMANDIVVGTVNDQQMQVAVNGIPAQVANRSFQAVNIPLSVGDNVISAVARDRAGNGATARVTVRRTSGGQARVVLVSGNNQSGQIGSLLSAPLVAGIVDDAGNPVSGQTMVFTVTQNNGALEGGVSTRAVTTNGQGQAQVLWALGTRSGAGNNVVTATAFGFAGTAIFTASGLPASSAQINVDAGSGQTGAVGQPLPHPFVVAVTDAGHNRLPNIPVTFYITQGGGSFNGQAATTTDTDSDGRALAVLTLGPQDGIANNVVEATFFGNPGFPAAFSASGRELGNPAATQITGVVLDNSNNPVPGITIRAFQTNVPAQASVGIPPNIAVQTDLQGQFSIQPAPVGFVKLIADGSTAQRPGSWPNLEYDLVTVAGQNNTIGMPIYLLPLDTQDQLCVSASTGGTLTLPQVPGFSLTVLPGSATFPGGAKSGCISVTTVHPDKIPMVPGFGQQPRFIVTIQPAGTLFNPPAAISIPNIEGLFPREVTEMYSFDHDLGTFVSIGTGTVSDDGTVIRTDPGVGVQKAGWFCGGPPTPTGSAGVCPECQKCVGSNCVADTAKNQTQCSLSDGSNGICLDGTCAGFRGVLTARDPFSGRSTTRFGIAEIIDLSFTANPPASAASFGGLQWRVISGGGTLAGGTDGTDTYTAASTPGTVVLRLEVASGPSQGQGHNYTITIVAPSGAHIVQAPGTNLRHTQSYAGVGFKGHVYLDPRDVSFMNIEAREGTVAGIGTGFYSYLNGRIHTTGSFFAVGPGNSTTGSQILVIDTIDTGDTSPPFSIGDFRWPIPREYRVNGGIPTQYTVITHHQFADSNGKATIEKGGAGPFSRNANDPTSSY